MPIQKGEIKTSVDLANPKQPISRIHPLYDGAGSLTAIEVEVLVLFSDGSTEGVAIDLLPLLPVAQRTILTNMLVAAASVVKGQLL